MTELNDEEARLIEELAAVNKTAAEEIEQLKMSDSTLADLEAIVKNQIETFTDFHNFLLEKKDEHITEADND